MQSWIDTALEADSAGEGAGEDSTQTLSSGGLGLGSSSNSGSHSSTLAQSSLAPATPHSTRFIKERETHKLEKRLCRLMGQAIVDYNMIGEGDKVMVCVSGGKDSYAMLDILLKLRERAPIHFDIVAVNLDQKQPGFPADVLPRYLSKLGVPYHIENQDTYSIVKDKIPQGKTMCSLCSRLRRGILYRVADELGATKIALGHHRDDILQTFFLNMFFGAKLKTMPPKLVSDDGRHIVIRPLANVPEQDLIDWAEHKAFPIIPCTLCGSVKPRGVFKIYFARCKTSPPHTSWTPSSMIFKTSQPQALPTREGTNSLTKRSLKLQAYSTVLALSSVELS